MTIKKFTFDLANLTIDGAPIMHDDLVVIFSAYALRHPNDRHIQNVLSYLAYHYAQEHASLTEILFYIEQHRAITESKLEQNSDKKAKLIYDAAIEVYDDIADKITSMMKDE